MRKRAQNKARGTDAGDVAKVLTKAIAAAPTPAAKRAIRTTVDAITRFPDTQPSQLGSRMRDLRRRRARNKVAKASRKGNR